MKTRYEVEYEVSAIIDEFKDEHDLENDFYGDCYPDEIMSLENQLEKAKDQEEYDYLIDELKEVLEQYL